MTIRLFLTTFGKLLSTTFEHIPDDYTIHLLKKTRFVDIVFFLNLELINVLENTVCFFIQEN